MNTPHDHYHFQRYPKITFFLLHAQKSKANVLLFSADAAIQLIAFLCCSLIGIEH
jgi:hypothetical protein